MMVHRPIRALCLASALTLTSASAAAPAPLAGALRELREVAAEGKGNVPASAAWKRVAAADAKAVPAILAAMDGANDYALNWLRAAAETIAQREAAAGRALPVAELRKFLADVKHHPKARRLAYELIGRAEPATARALLPGFINDPGNELRREAVQERVDAAAKDVATDKAAAIAGFRSALGYSREADQVGDIAKRLTDLGEKVDLQAAFGWVTRWKLIGPFDNTGGAGFEKAFAPERSVDLAAEADGKTAKVRWVDLVTKSDYGLIDFNQPFTELKEVTGYAYAEFWSEKARTAQVRIGTDNGWKLWVNGKFLFGREEYHRNTEVDQYRVPVELKAGSNTFLVKCTQNEQVEDWTKTWQFQLRVTDDLGTPIVPTQ